MGGLVESGANLGNLQPCVGQISDIVESLYFTYFYVRAFIEKRGLQYISYMSVYVSRGIESVTHGPCWSIKEEEEPAPSEQQMQAEVFMSKAGLSSFLPKRGPMVKAGAFENELTEEQSLAELNSIAGKLAGKLTKSLSIVMALFTVMEVLEILIDCLTFNDLYVQSNWFDAGVIAGKGLVNTGFTLYYIIMEYTAEAGTFQRFDWESEGGIF